MARRPPVDPPFVDSTAALASLYQAPWPEFITRRAALVKQLKQSGHTDVAGRIASAAKPSRAAYLVNQVYWHARQLYDAVLEAGTTARAAQQARLLGDAATDLAETLRRRDRAIDDALARASLVAADEGAPLSDAIGTQVRASFEALAAHGLDARLAHGQFTADVELPGFAAFAGLVLPSDAPASSPPRRFEVVARRAAPAPSPAASAAPDPRVVEAEARVARLAEAHAGAIERRDAVARGSASAADVASAAEAEADRARRAADDARAAAGRASAALDAAEQDLARTVAELEAARADAAALQGSGQPPEPSPPAGGPVRRPGRPRR